MSALALELLFVFFFYLSQKEDMIIWHRIADAFEILKEVCPPEARSLSLSSYTQDGFCSDGPTPPQWPVLALQAEQPHK